MLLLSASTVISLDLLVQAANVKRRARVWKVFVVLFQDFAERREVDVHELFEFQKPLTNGINLIAGRERLVGQKVV